MTRSSTFTRTSLSPDGKVDVA